MKQKKLSRWLKCLIIGVGICAIIIYALIIPFMGISLRDQYPEFSYCFWPWLIFIWATGIPCCIILIIGWEISSNIGSDRAFSEINAKLFEWISFLTAGDSAFFFVGNVVFFSLNMSHPSIVLASFFIVFIGVAISVACSVLSHLVRKAAILQDQSDLTI